MVVQRDHCQCSKSSHNSPRSQRTALQVKIGSQKIKKDPAERRKMTDKQWKHEKKIKKDKVKKKKRKEAKRQQAKHTVPLKDVDGVITTAILRGVAGTGRRTHKVRHRHRVESHAAIARGHAQGVSLHAERRVQRIGASSGALTHVADSE
jgi:hypothetical protein